jgi:beta-lactam-binding protein with PASTA domain
MLKTLLFTMGIVWVSSVQQLFGAEIQYKDVMVHLKMTDPAPISVTVRDYTNVQFVIPDNTPAYDIQLVKAPDCAVQLAWKNAANNNFFLYIGKADCKQTSFSLSIVDRTKRKSPLISFNVSQAESPPIKKEFTTRLSKNEIKLGESVILQVSGGKSPYHVSGSCTGAKPNEYDQCMKVERLADDSFKLTPLKIFLDAEKCNFMATVQDSTNTPGTASFNVVNPNWKPKDKLRLYYVNYPDFKGMTRIEAEGLVKKEGFSNVTFVEAAPEMHNQIGKVIKQDPIPGTKTFQRFDSPNEDPGAARKQLYAHPIVLTIGSKGSFVPDMLLKTEAEAVNLIKNAGFVPRVVYYPETISGMVGKVKNSEPLPHRSLSPGGTVTLTVGRSSFDMPNVVGTPLAHATQNLDLISKAKSLNLKYTVTTKDTPNPADDGKVFDQNPKAGSALAPGTAIALSAYRWVYQMPNFTGKTDREAFAALNQVNSSRPGFIKMSATQTKDSADQTDNDRIHDQNPKPGTIVQPGTTAIFYTYRYKPSAPATPSASYIVPNVVNKYEHDAAREIQSAGGKLLRTQYILSNQSRNGRVVAQSIPAGTKTTEAVGLTVGKFR